MAKLGKKIEDIPCDGMRFAEFERELIKARTDEGPSGPWPGGSNSAASPN